MVVNLRDSADAESNNTDTYNQNKRDEWFVGDGTSGFELANIHDPAVSDLADEASVSETLYE